MSENEVVSEFPSEPISEKIPKDRSNEGYDAHVPEIQYSGLREKPSKNRYRMAGNEQSDDWQGLRNGRGEHYPIPPMAQYCRREGLDGMNDGHFLCGLDIFDCTEIFKIRSFPITKSTEVREEIPLTRYMRRGDSQAKPCNWQHPGSRLAVASTRCRRHGRSPSTSFGPWALGWPRRCPIRIPSPQSGFSRRTGHPNSPD